jgi:uncharacterized membrane protein YGL010W
MTTRSESRLPQIFSDYERYHQHPVNKLCHYMGIPVIVFTLVGLLGGVPLVDVGTLSLSLAVPVAVLALAYDLRLSPRLTAPFGLFVLAALVLAPSVPARLLWAGFAGGWVLQFVGHYVFERKSPAFFINVQQLLVGPLWMLGTLTGMPSAPKKARGSARPSS